MLSPARAFLERESGGCLAGRKRQRRHPTFKGSNALFQHVIGRIHDPRIDVAEFFQRKEIGRVFGIAELKRGRLINRHGDRTGCGVCPPTRVKKHRFRMI
jgi:hypothetical protein